MHDVNVCSNCGKPFTGPDYYMGGRSFCGKCWGELNGEVDRPKRRHR